MKLEQLSFLSELYPDNLELWKSRFKKYEVKFYVGLDDPGRTHICRAFSAKDAWFTTVILFGATHGGVSEIEENEDGSNPSS